MKIKCPSCGKKEMELMSKAEILIKKDSLNGFVNETILSTVVRLAMDWLVPNKYVCKNCGYMKDS